MSGRQEAEAARRSAETAQAKAEEAEAEARVTRSQAEQDRSHAETSQKENERSVKQMFEVALRPLTERLIALKQPVGVVEVDERWTPLLARGERTLPRDAPRNQPEPAIAALVRDHTALLPKIRGIYAFWRRGRRTIGLMAILAALEQVAPGEPRKLECRWPRARRQFDVNTGAPIDAGREALRL